MTFFKFCHVKLIVRVFSWWKKEGGHCIGFRVKNGCFFSFAENLHQPINSNYLNRKQNKAKQKKNEKSKKVFHTIGVEIRKHT